MKTIVTHNGDFHLDDVLAVAVIELKEGMECTIIRTRDNSLFDSADYVVDIGQVYHAELRRFDHHQQGGAGERATPDRIPYASCGLVWKEYGTEICGSALIAEMMDDRIFKPVDALDNGIEIAHTVFETLRLPLVSDIVHVFKPTWKEADTTDALFRQFVTFAKTYINRTITILKDNIEAEDLVRNAYGEAVDKRIIILDQSLPFQEVLMRYPEPLFVIYPSESQPGIWRIKCVKLNKFGFENRKDLRSEWAGLIPAELRRVSGIPTIQFVHNKLFTGSAGTKQDAIEMARLSLEG